MKTIISIPAHSMTDLVTNSSSETFICSTDKSVEMVKAILQSLLDKYNEQVPAIRAKEIADNGYAYTCERTFSGCFGDIFVSPVSFDFEGLSDAYVKDPNSPYPEYPNYAPLKELDGDFQKLLEEHRNWTDRVFPNDGRRKVYPSRRKHKVRYHKKHRVTWGIIHRHQEKVFADFNAKWNAYDADIVRRNFVANGLEFNDFFSTRTNKRRWARSYELGMEFNEEKDPTITRLYNFCFNWHQSVKKGDILIESCDDNSIPYSLWDEINSIFNARNVHCG